MRTRFFYFWNGTLLFHRHCYVLLCIQSMTLIIVEATIDVAVPAPDKMGPVSGARVAAVDSSALNITWRDPPDASTVVSINNSIHVRLNLTAGGCSRLPVPPVIATARDVVSFVKGALNLLVVSLSATLEYQ